MNSAKPSVYRMLLRNSAFAVGIGAILLTVWFYSLNWHSTMDMWQALLASIVLLVLPLFFAALAFLRYLNVQLDKHASYARKLSLGEHSDSISVSPYREFAELGQQLNTLADSIYDQKRRFESQSRDLSRQVALRTKELKDASDKAVQMAMVDPLTKLPNRAALARQLHQIIRSIGNSRNSIALLFIDIDHFKRLNDSLGHEIGDVVLKHVAGVLGRHLPSESIVARLGGDEFVVVLGKMPADDAQATTDLYIQNIYAELAQKLQFDDFSTLVTISCGAALYPRDAFDVATLLRAADSAMYVAKEAGRARAEWFSQSHVEAQNQKVSLEQDLRQAIAENQFTIYYQPQVSLSDNSPSGIEALVRWQHPERGLVSPAEFIPLAEENGLIVSMGALILDVVCAQAARWRAQGQQMRVAINLSVRQLEQQEWLKRLDSIVMRYNLPPYMVELEVTETAISKNPEKMAETLKAMANKGFIITLDDFGTGYSSLNYLATLPFQNVKIDKQFIWSLDKPGSYKIVQSIIAMGHALNLRIIAEGVETPKQYQTLRELGCDEVQGFYVSEPMPSEKVLSWWKNQHKATDMFGDDQTPMGYQA